MLSTFQLKFWREFTSNLNLIFIINKQNFENKFGEKEKKGEQLFFKTQIELERSKCARILEKSLSHVRSFCSFPLTRNELSLVELSPKAY